MKFTQERDPWYTKKTWAEISEGALVNNLELVRSKLADGRVLIAPVVKADAYGHGAGLVVPVLEKAGVDTLFVATIDEAISIRQMGSLSRIVIFGATKSDYIPYLKEYNLIQSIVTEAERAAFEAASLRVGGPPLEVQIKLDTGMARLGLPRMRNTGKGRWGSCWRSLPPPDSRCQVSIRIYRLPAAISTIWPFNAGASSN